MTTRIKRAAATLGLDIGMRRNTLNSVRRSWMIRAKVELLIDGGANIGQYSSARRKEGYRGSIMSIEPSPVAYLQLANRAHKDADWVVLQCALGSQVDNAALHLSENSVSSSLMKPSNLHTFAAPGAKIVGSVPVRMVTLDALAGDRVFSQATACTMLKLDLQGSELEALIGATGILEKCVLIECELSLSRVYDDQPIAHEVIAWLAKHGFDLVWFERGLTEHHHRRTLQVDGLFVRHDVLDGAWR